MGSNEKEGNEGVGNRDSMMRGLQDYSEDFPRPPASCGYLPLHTSCPEELVVGDGVKKTTPQKR